MIDSSDDESVQEVVRERAQNRVRNLRFYEPGLGTAFNFGLREATHEVVLLTNDDCTVEPSWIGAGLRAISRTNGLIVTGRVRPHGDPAVVPSTIDDLESREYAGRPDFVLFTQSMAVRRTEILEFGGFDGRIRPTAEDNDLSYRWLRAGRRIRYESDFVVWHHDWRNAEQLEQLYVNYGIGQGMVYGKHLRHGDLLIVRYLLTSLLGIGRGVAARLVGRSRRLPDPRLGMLRGLPIGLVRGWRAGRV